MGGAVSHGIDNSDLVTKLCDADYVKSPNVEFALRAVDRAIYFPEGLEGIAYRDLAYKNGDIHLSAPCIYCEVLEGLEIKEGLSFLNIGSGTGYLSTLVGVILGANGTNHGVEIHKNVVQFARVKLQYFLDNIMPDMFGVEFCEPVFVVGDGLCINPCYRQYDRVYCGAAVDSKHEDYMKSLVKVGGILVMPFQDTLQKIYKISETEFETITLLPVSFSPLINSSEGKDFANSVKNTIEIASTPATLQASCRRVIRRLLGAKNLMKLKKLNLPLPKPVIHYILYR